MFDQWRRWVVAAVVAVAAATAAVAETLEVADQPPLHKISFAHDSRQEIRLVSFGFLPGGQWNITLSNLQLHDAAVDTLLGGGGGNDDASNNLVGLVLRRTATPAAANSALELCTKPAAQVVDNEDASMTFYPFPNGTTWWNNSTALGEADAALWSAVMVSCRSTVRLSFEFAYQMQNPGPKYLSAGEEPLPVVLGMYSIVFFVISVAWTLVLTYSRDRRVLWPHWVMLALFLIKSMLLAIDAMKYQYRLMGINSGGWDISYYVFFILKGEVQFAFLFLIATGWVFVKPYLTDREKMVLAVVVILQVISNVAFVLYSEIPDTSTSWAFWWFSFVVVDLACCVIVVLPTLRTQQHIAQSDPEGKTEALQSKYKLWGRLYTIIFLYAYFTRIVVLLIRATSNYRVSWLAEFFEELSNVCFYIYVCYAFKPVIDNPYFEVKMDDDDDFEEIPLESFGGRLKHRNAGSRRAVNGHNGASSNDHSFESE